MLVTQFSRFHPGVCFLQYPNYLLFRKMLLHRCLLLTDSSFALY